MTTDDSGLPDEMQADVDRWVGEGGYPGDHPIHETYDELPPAAQSEQGETDQEEIAA